ncbi:MAG: FAD-dependent monooxygenase [Endozoicomonadaceae bacterium]|nr:FAD-dependent monooxygenase [Endozoicomonadaceae bacterium]
MPCDSSYSAEKQPFDITIIGGGINGLAMAMALSNTTLRIAVVDTGSLTGSADPFDQHDPRVCALTESSRQLLDRLGAWALMRDVRVTPYTRMKVWDSDGVGHITFSAEEAGLSTLGHIVENRVTTNALLQRLHETPAITLLGNTEITSLLQNADGVLLATNADTSLQSRLVIAADGANSAIRRMAGIPTREWDYQHHAIVTTVQTERYHQDTAWQVFMRSGPLAFLPLPSIGEAHYCSIVWSVVPDQARQLMAISEDEFCCALERVFESRLGKVLSTDRRYCMNLRQRHARQYHSGRIVLVGDAAHSIHPLAGQGVNLGLLDVRVLAEEICHACGRGGDYVDDLLLARYQRRREPHNLIVMGVMQGFQQLFGSNPLLFRWIRNASLNLTDQIPFLKKQIVRQVMNP